MKYHSILLLIAAMVLWAGCRPVHDDTYQEDVRTTEPTTTRPADTATPPPQPPPQDPAVATTPAPTEPDATEQVPEQQQELAIATVERSLEDIDTRLESVVQTVEQLDENAQAEVLPVLETLRDQREELDLIVEQMRTANGEQWEEIQRDFQAAYRSFLDTLEATEELLRG
jgi:hypothetical protein